MEFSWLILPVLQRLEAIKGFFSLICGRVHASYDSARLHAFGLANRCCECTIAQKITELSHCAVRTYSSQRALDAPCTSVAKLSARAVPRSGNRLAPVT